MANVDFAFGFSPERHLQGVPYSGQTEVFHVPSSDGTAIFRGTPVKLAGSADSRGIPDVTAAVSGDTIIGVMTSVRPVTRDSEIFREASTERYVEVVTDPYVLFEIQEDSDTSTLAADDVGLNASWVGSGGDTNTGLSSIELDSSTAATTNTLDMQILRLADRPDNEIGDFAVWLVRLNNHQYRDQQTGV